MGRIPAVEEVKRVAVVGAGTMGSGVALTFARAGYEVSLQARRQESLARALATIDGACGSLREAGVLSHHEAKAISDRIRATTDLAEAVDGCQFVSENIPERLELKHEVFRELDRLLPEAILTTDTSGLSITEIASAAKDPSRVVGLHWVNPPHLIPLVEVIPGERTSPEAAETVYALSKRIGKAPVRLRKEVKGFLANRLQFALLREAFHLYEQGVASAEDLDTVLKKGMGFRWAVVGPFELIDLGGLDSFYNVSKYLMAELNRSPDPPRALGDPVSKGRLGIKAGAGFFEYPPGKAGGAVARRDALLIELLKVLQGGS